MARVGTGQGQRRRVTPSRRGVEGATVKAIRELALALPSDEELVRQYASETWRPTPQQARFLAVVKAARGRSITARHVCQALGYPVYEVASWLDSAEFRERFRDAWRLLLERELVGVVAALIERAKRGDVQAAKLCLELAGVYVPPRYRVDVQATVSLESVLHDSRRILEARVVPQAVAGLEAARQGIGQAVDGVLEQVIAAREGQDHEVER